MLLGSVRLWSFMLAAHVGDLGELGECRRVTNRQFHPQLQLEEVNGSSPIAARLTTHPAFKRGYGTR